MVITTEWPWNRTTTPYFLCLLTCFPLIFLSLFSRLFSQHPLFFIFFVYLYIPVLLLFSCFLLLSSVCLWLFIAFVLFFRQSLFTLIYHFSSSSFRLSIFALICSFFMCYFIHGLYFHLMSSFAFSNPLLCFTFLYFTIPLLLFANIHTTLLPLCQVFKRKFTFLAHLTP
jgi:hypothetical protein